MSISKTRNYLLLNYCSSPVAVSTRYDSFLIPGGTEAEPGSLPFTIDEIAVINSNSQALRIGMLWPEPEFREEIYEEIRVPAWQTILTDREIRDILLNPTLDGMQKLLSIENDAYFERIRGIYMGLINAGADISNKVATMMEARRQEFAKNQRKTKIVLTPHEDKTTSDKDQRIAELEASMEAMRRMMEEYMSQKADTPKPTKSAARTKTAATKETAKKSE